MIADLPAKPPHSVQANQGRRALAFESGERFRSYAVVRIDLLDILVINRKIRKLLGRLMINSAEPRLRRDRLHVRGSGDALLVGFGQRIDESGLVVASDPQRGCARGQHLIEQHRHTYHRREDEQRDRDRKDRQDRAALAAHQILEYQAQIFHCSRRTPTGITFGPYALAEWLCAPFTQPPESTPASTPLSSR